MATQTVAGKLEKHFDKPLAELSTQLRRFAEAYIPKWSELSAKKRKEKALEVDRQRDVKDSIKLGRIARELEKQKADLEVQAENTIGWYDATLSAATWFGLTSIAPREAAMLLCRFDPHDEKLNPTECSTDETEPNDFKLLLRVLEDVANAESQHRSLLQWLSIARDKGVKYHSWIDEYVNGTVLVEASNTGDHIHLRSQIQKCIDRKESKIPAPLFGEGFGEDARKITTLTKWLEFETWPAMWAALLVCGIQPPDIEEFIEMPEKGSFGLDNSMHMGNEDCFHEAKRILTVWKCKADAPAMVRPVEFVEWCQTKGINTDWLSALSEGSPVIAAPVKVKPTRNESGTQSVTTHKIETRTNALTAAISKAIESALCPNDVHSIWAAFVAMAEAKNRPLPLLGYVETEGVKYQDESGVAFITKENFLRRVRRRLTSKNH